MIGILIYSIFNYVLYDTVEMGLYLLSFIDASFITTISNLFWEEWIKLKLKPLKINKVKSDTGK